ncbi:hypothetical protein KJK34_01095 [Flavobacterium sp. D11R37]|uniref:hypothetical protein n=1 Tax=Flavobacterium coralii TaxID=2838017 RepID=UPI001CA6F78D|nr:hypothetical protein [Flavobacterium coralii]MBY8961340.1 hypothetical protein [Flavobacterium coralii]
MNLAKKIAAIFIIIILSIMIAGIYGILHDQITYSISPEYYTKFKFIQFRLLEGNDTPIRNLRLLVAVTGWMATWWVGFIIGIILSMLALRQNLLRAMITTSVKAILITIAVAIISGIAGYTYGSIIIIYQPEPYAGWYIPESVTDINSFVIVGSIHNFSYMGALAGLIIAVYFNFRKRSEQNT